MNPVAFVMLDPDTRRRHLYVAGQTSTGKSTLLLNLIAQDLAACQGLAVLDPTAILPRPRCCTCRETEQRDNAVPTRPSSRSVEPALTLLWEASTPDERHQRRHQVR